MIKVLPKLLNQEMVMALIAGRKTQTRLPMKPQPFGAPPSIICHDMDDGKYGFFDDEKDYFSPLGKPGDLLYVRETWADSTGGVEFGYCLYRADLPWHWDAKDTEHGEDVDLRAEDFKWRPSLHMLRKDSRFTLLVKRVWIERVQDIIEADARAEGANKWFPASEHLQQHLLYGSYRNEFHKLWDSIYGKPRKPGGPAYPWKDNPRVFASEFELIRMNVDEYLKGLK